eukprot:403364588
MSQKTQDTSKLNSSQQTSQKSVSQKPPRKPSQLVQLVTLLHNLSQIAGWSYVFYLTVSNLVPTKPSDQPTQNFLKSLNYSHYYTIPQFRQFVEVFQTLQVLDVIFSILRFTNNSVMATFPQYVSRIFVVYGVFPYVANPDGQYSIILCVLMWSTIEVIRFSFYTVKQYQFLADSPIAVLLGYIRYNTFIPVYPTGVSGELLAVYHAVQTIQYMLIKPYTIRMPNQWNFAFDYQLYLTITPLFYILGFPGLYMHMFRQRAKFHKEQRDKGKLQSKDIKQD